MGGTQTRSYQTASPRPTILVQGELRVPIQAILIHANDLLQAATGAAEGSESAQLLPDLQRVLNATQQLDGLIDGLFKTRLTAAGDVDLAAFSSTIRHDLRTPVNAIIGYSEMLLEDTDNFEEPLFYSAGLQDILNAGRRLLTLINELIYYAQAEAAHGSNAAPLPNQPISSTLMLDELAIAGTVDGPLPLPINEAGETDLGGGSLLVVDDRESNRDLLSRQLQRYGFQVDVAESGQQALDMLAAQDYELVLLDIIMPGLNGYQVLAQLKADEVLQHIPVIMISALDEIDSVVRCIEMGAQDYLQKPFNPIILKAKITASLERKRLRDRERAFLKQLQQEQERSEKLLLNILPPPIAQRLKHGERTIADSFDEVTVLFADLVHFTQLSAGISPAQLVERLNDIFLAFDILAELYGLEKIKTIGDAYMLVGGVPTYRPDHAEAVAEIAIDMLDAIERLNRQNHTNFSLRVGMHTGPVIAGVIGKHKFNYDLWGDAVNIASRMESHGLPGQIQLTEDTYQRIQDKFLFEKRGLIPVKGKGEMVTYFLTGRKTSI